MLGGTLDSSQLQLPMGIIISMYTLAFDKFVENNYYKTICNATSSYKINI